MMQTCEKSSCRPVPWSRNSLNFRIYLDISISLSNIPRLPLPPLYSYLWDHQPSVCSEMWSRARGVKPFECLQMNRTFTSTWVVITDRVKMMPTQQMVTTGTQRAKISIIHVYMESNDTVETHFFSKILCGSGAPRDSRYGPMIPDMDQGIPIC